MSEIPQLLAAIESRLAGLADEITALEAAKTALDGSRPAGQGPAIASAKTTRSRRRPTRGRPGRSPKQTAPVTPSRAPEPVVVAQNDGSTATPTHPARKRSANARPPPRRAHAAVRAETLERLLVDTSAGLSASAIAEQTGAGYNPTLKLLRELEAAGKVRRSGSRRSTVWRLITDEERIAERAAELERRRSAPHPRAREG